jgi:hypothetical protein
VAASDGRPVPLKNVAYRYSCTIRDNSGERVTATLTFDSGLASGANKALISKDGGAWANSTNNVTGYGEGAAYLDLTTSEMNADTVHVITVVTNVGAVDDDVILNPEEAGDIRVTLSDPSLIGDLPTNAELTAALAAADDAVLSAIAALSIPTAAQNAAALLDLADGIETGVTPRQALRGVSAILCGIVSGGGSGTEVFKAVAAAAGGTTRVTVTADGSGNRSAVVLNL